MAKKIRPRILWSEPALVDLDAIADYIALDDVAAAQRLVRRVIVTVGRLAHYPHSGRRVPELLELNLDYREVLVPPCRILYRVEHRDVIIVLVMRGEQALTSERLEGR